MAFSQQSPLDNPENGAASETKEGVRELKADYAQLKEDLATLRRDLAALSAGGAAELKRKFKSGASKAEAKAHAAADYASTELQELQVQAESAIRRNPLSAVGAALAIGYLFSSLTRR